MGTKSNPSGDKFVGLACQSDGMTICALTESGKIRCFNKENTHLPKFKDGDLAAQKGKFVYMDMEKASNYPAILAIRDDGVVELIGSAKSSNNGYEGTRKTRTAPTGERFV